MHALHKSYRGAPVANLDELLQIRLSDPEKRLWFRVIIEALLDSFSETRQIRTDADEFLRGETKALYWIARAVGMNANAIKSFYRKHKGESLRKVLMNEIEQRKLDGHSRASSVVGTGDKND